MKKIVLLGFATVLFVSCGENNKKNQSETENQPQIKTVSSEPVIHEPAEMTAKFKDSLVGKAYRNYNGMKSALVNSDQKKVRDRAKTLLETLSQMEFTENIRKAVQTMAEAENLGKQREAFQIVTAEMTKLVEGNLTSGKLYYQYCPMAFGGKGGFWLSNSENIRNPYYGNAMLKCGEVRKVIQ